jgi:ATP citrate (pro-S)-lyase
MPISEIFKKTSTVVSRLRAPKKFIEMILMITTDHGPSVSDVHNTIAAKRAGKDLVSSLTSGLTIGSRFSGVLDAAIMFANSSDVGVDAEQFVKDMLKQNKLIVGISHRIKSLAKPDKRVDFIKNYVSGHETRPL